MFNHDEIDQLRILAECDGDLDDPRISERVLSCLVEGLGRRRFIQAGVSSPLVLDGFSPDRVTAEDELVTLRGVAWSIGQERMSCRARFWLDPGRKSVLRFDLCYGSAWQGHSSVEKSRPDGYIKPSRWLVRIDNRLVAIHGAETPNER